MGRRGILTVPVDWALAMRHTVLFVAACAAFYASGNTDIVQQLLANPAAPWAVFFIILAPIYWNLAPQLFAGWLIRVCGGARRAMLVFAASIIVLSGYRSYLFSLSVATDDTDGIAFAEGSAGWHTFVCRGLGSAIFLVGSVILTGALYHLGIYGTYMGEFFSIMLSEKITSFPFNVVANPMYFGSSLVHFGTALISNSPIGMALSFLVMYIYFLGALYEQPLMAKMYAEPQGKIRVKNGWDIVPDFTKAA